MKKIRARFTVYFAIGSLLFLIYFFFTFEFIIHNITALMTGDFKNIQMFVYSIDSGASLILYAFVIVFCFLSGGFLFSLFLVNPVSHIIRIITSLTVNSNDECFNNILNKRGKIKRCFFLYGEVISNLALLKEALGRAEEKRARIDEARNNWVAGVSHDLKTPLSYINGYASLLMNAEHEWKKEELHNCIKEIYNKGVHIEKLINDLNFTFFIDDIKDSQLNFKKNDLVSFLRNLLADAASAPKADKLRFDFRTSAVQLYIGFDERLMYRALYNIITNCIEHNPDGTEIVVSLFQKGGKVCIDISDNGVGIPDNEMSAIFEKYCGGTKNQDGKGLGLFISRQIIEAHGASVTVQNNNGGGTVFHVLLDK